VRFQEPELADALVASGPDAVPELDLDRLRQRRILDLCRRIAGAGQPREERENEDAADAEGSRSGHHRSP
jgi:hypothetical protein